MDECYSNPSNKITTVVDVHMLIKAICCNNISKLQHLLAQIQLSKPIDFKRANTIGETPLHAAACSRNIHILEILLDPKNRPYIGDINDRDITGNTALTYMISHDFSDGVSYLLEHAATGDVDMPDLRGHTPLMQAARYDKAEILSILLDNGASIDLYDSDGTSALAEACYNVNPTCVDILLGRNATIDVDCRCGPSILFELVNRTANADSTNPLNIVYIMDILIEKGAQPQKCDASGASLLRVAMERYPVHRVGVHPVVLFLLMLDSKIKESDVDWSKHVVSAVLSDGGSKNSIEHKKHVCETLKMYIGSDPSKSDVLIRNTLDRCGEYTSTGPLTTVDNLQTRSY